MANQAAFGDAFILDATVSHGFSMFQPLSVNVAQATKAAPWWNMFGAQSPLDQAAHGEWVQKELEILEMPTAVAGGSESKQWAQWAATKSSFYMYDAFESECFNSMVFHADFPKVSGQFSVGRSAKAKVAA